MVEYKCKLCDKVFIPVTKKNICYCGKECRDKMIRLKLKITYSELSDLNKFEKENLCELWEELSKDPNLVLPSKREVIIKSKRIKGICKYCGNKFRSIYSYQLYCSQKCYDINLKIKKEKLNK